MFNTYSVSNLNMYPDNPMHIYSTLLVLLGEDLYNVIGIAGSKCSISIVSTILCDGLNHKFGLTGLALQWLRSYLADWSQFFCNDERYETLKIHYGVPQGSDLGPLYFLLYSVDLFDIVTSHGLKVHGYADDL